MDEPLTTIDNVVKQITSGEWVPHCAIMFEDSLLHFTLTKSDPVIRVQLDKGPRCLYMEFNLETKQSELNYLLYHQDKQECDGVRDKGYGNFLLKVSDAWNVGFEMKRCYLMDASRFGKLRAALAYAMDHHGLTWYMSHHYLVYENRKGTIVNDVEASNQLIERLNHYWQSSSSRNLKLLSELDITPLKSATKEQLGIIHENFEWMFPAFVKYYPDQYVIIEPGDDTDPARFTLTEKGIELNKQQLQMLEMVQRVKDVQIVTEEVRWIQDYLRRNDFTYAQLLPDETQSYWVKAIDVTKFQKGPSEYVMVGDIHFVSPEEFCPSLYSIVKVEPLFATPFKITCESATYNLRHSVFDPMKNPSRDTIYLLRWLSGHISPEDPHFWKRYQKLVQKILDRLRTSVIKRLPEWISECEHATMAGMGCVVRGFATIAKCHSFCQSHTSQSLHNLITVLNRVTISESNDMYESALHLIEGEVIAKKGVRVPMQMDLHEPVRTILQYELPFSIRLQYERMHGEAFPPQFDLFGYWEGHRIDLNPITHEVFQSTRLFIRLDVEITQI